MRGKDVAGVVSSGTNRITPAHAGKRAFTHTTTLTKRDHPRTCGEKILRNQGSSDIPGITPAHAGKSFFARACLIGQ